jgi:hypothetical protein
MVRLLAMRRLVMVLAVLSVGGCGGDRRQDADEPSGTFRVEVAGASFPKRQRVAESVELKVGVRNADDETLRNVAVTVETKPAGDDAAIAFGERSSASGAADPSRPIWVLAEGPVGGAVATVNTWSAGTLRAGETKELTWRLVASRAGSYTVDYRVAPGLTGRARAARGRTGGSFDVTIADEPVPARVGEDGEVIRGPSR